LHELCKVWSYSHLSWTCLGRMQNFHQASGSKLGCVWIEVKESFNFANLGMFGLKSRKLEKVTETQSFYLMTIISSVIS
jgi:hypothetical protein